MLDGFYKQHLKCLQFVERGIMIFNFPKAANWALIGIKEKRK